MKSLLDSLYQFNIYLKGGSDSDLRRYMCYYDQALIRLNTDFNLTTIDNKDIINNIQDILANLNIPPRQWGRYFGSNLTIYDFFVELKKENHIQIDFILESIDEKNQLWQHELFFSLSLAILCVVIFSCFPTLRGVFQAIGHFLISVIGLPIIGLLFTSSVVLFNVYQSVVDKKKTHLDRYRDNFFIIVNALINIIAYSLWIATATTTMTPLIASLFVVASMLEVIKEMVSFLQDYHYYSNCLSTIEGDNLAIERDHIRHKFGFKKHRNAAIINLATAVILVGVMAVWCFMPASILITVCAIVAILTVYIIKYQLSKYNAAVSRDTLQQELRQIEHIDEKNHLTIKTSLDRPTNPNNYISKEDYEAVMPPINNSSQLVNKTLAKSISSIPNMNPPIAAILPFYLQNKSKLNIPNDIEKYPTQVSSNT